MSASTKRRGRHGHAVTLTTVVVSVLLHAFVVGMILWERSSTAPVEAVTVEAVEVELVEEPPEETAEEKPVEINLADILPNFSQAEEALTPKNASEADSQDTEKTESTDTAESASESEKTEAVEKADAEAPQDSASQAEAAESEAAESETAPESATSPETADTPEAPDADAPAEETAGEQNSTDAIAEKLASLPPPSPIATGLGTPDSLYGREGSGPNALADPTEAETAAATDTPSDTPVPETAAPPQAEPSEEPPTEATPARSAAQSDTDGEATTPAPETETAESALPEGELNDSESDARLAMLATESPDAELSQPTEAEEAATSTEEATAPLTDETAPEEPAAPPAAASEGEETGEAAAELVDPLALADTPVRYRENPLPVANPDREAVPDDALPKTAAPAPAGGISEALRQALASGLFGSGPSGIGSGTASQVAYTEALRSAIAPLFFNEMRNIDARGTAVVELVIARSGEVISAKLVQRSSSDALNAAALYAARGASYPPLPSDVKGDRQAFHIPLRAR